MSPLRSMGSVEGYGLGGFGQGEGGDVSPLPPADASPYDPGFQANGAWEYQDGTLKFDDGTIRTPSGDWAFPNGALYTATDHTFRDENGNITTLDPQAAAQVQAAAQSGTTASVLAFLKQTAADVKQAAIDVASVIKAVRTIFHPSQVPPGTRVGEIFRGPDGRLYRLNADGSGSLVSSAPRPAGIAGLSPVLLIGVGVVALMMFGKGRR